MSASKHAPAAADPATLSAHEAREMRQELAMGSALLREVCARLEEGAKVGLEKKDFVARWGITMAQVAYILRASGVKGRQYGARTVWLRDDLPRLDAAFKRLGTEVSI